MAERWLNLYLQLLSFRSDENQPCHNANHVSHTYAHNLLSLKSKNICIFFRLSLSIFINQDVSGDYHILAVLKKTARRSATGFLLSKVLSRRQDVRKSFNFECIFFAWHSWAEQRWFVFPMLAMQLSCRKRTNYKSKERMQFFTLLQILLSIPVPARQSPNIIQKGKK